MAKKYAMIDNVIIVTNNDKPVLYSVEYVSGRKRHLFPRLDIIPDRVCSFIESSISTDITSNMTVYRHGIQ